MEIDKYDISNWEKLKNNNDKFFAKLSNNTTEDNFFSSLDDGFSSLTGKENISFKHNNMEPFYNKNTQPNLDKYVIDCDKSTHNLFHRKKELTKETFFSPDSIIENVNGSGFEYETLRNNVNRSVLNLNNNVFPIDQIKVGPGLDNGYDIRGTGGFHDFNTNIYAMPKNKDELRSSSYQKEKTFAVDYQAPKMEIGQQRGVVSAPSKNKPERVYEQKSENFLRTTGAILKDSNRPIENIKATHKQDSHIDYSGNIKITNPGASENDNYNKESIFIYDNERKTTECKTVMNNPTSVIKALIAPILDGVKLSKKQYTIDAPRETGGNVSSEVSKATVYDPVNYITKTTIKETTVHDAQNSNLKGNDGTYTALHDDAKKTVKETTVHDAQILNLKGTTEESYSKYEDVMKTTVKETTPIVDNIRNIGPTVYKTYVYDPDIVAKTTVKETTIKSKTEYGFIGGLLNRLVGGYFNKDIKLNNTNKEFTVQSQTRGNVSSVYDHRPKRREAYYEASQDDTRERILIASGYTPNPGNMNINIDASDVNMKVDKNVVHDKNFGHINKIYQEREPNNFYKDSITKETIQDNAYEHRLDSSIMAGLKSNELSIQINPIYE